MWVVSHGKSHAEIESEQVGVCRPSNNVDEKRRSERSFGRFGRFGNCNTWLVSETAWQIGGTQEPRVKIGPCVGPYRERVERSAPLRRGAAILYKLTLKAKFESSAVEEG